MTTTADAERNPGWPVYPPTPLWYIRPLGDTFGSEAAS